MKIVFILIVHLGLVAVQAVPQAARCQALKELDDYFFVAGEDKTGTKLSGMLDKYVRQGVITKAVSDDFKKQIPEHARGKRLASLATKIETFIQKQTCNCTGNVGKNNTVRIVGSNDEVKITGLNFGADIVKVNAKGQVVELEAEAGTIRLDVKAGSIELKATAEKTCLMFSCVTCNAINEILNYIAATSDDPDAVGFWDLMDHLVDEGLITTQTFDHSKALFAEKGWHVTVFRKDKPFANPAFQIINYLKANSQKNCCGNVGVNASQSCEIDISKEEAIDQLKEFINKNEKDIVKLWTKVNNFFIGDVISDKQWKSYRKKLNGDLKGKPKELAETVLLGVRRNIAIIELDLYMRTNPMKKDPNAVKLFDMLRKYKKEGAMTKKDYEACEDAFKSCRIRENPYFMADFMKVNLDAGMDFCWGNT